MPVFRVVYPASERDSRLIQYEYMLLWLSPSGGVRQWLFTNVNVSLNESFENTTIETLSSIRSVPNKEMTEISLVAESLSEEDYNYIKSLMQSNLVYRMDKEGGLTSVAIKSGSVNTSLKQKEYTIRINIQLKEPYLLDV